MMHRKVEEETIDMSNTIHRFHRKAKGASLIELGMVMLFISLALAPVIKMVGGPQSRSGEGGTARVNSIKTQETVLANTMVDKVLSGDYAGFDCNASGSPVSFDPSTDLPKGTTASTSVRQFNRCKVQGSNTGLQYQWTVVHLSSFNNGFSMPQLNRYYQATFNVFDKDNNVIFTLPTNFFYNEGAYQPPRKNTGVMFAMDVSGSMGASSVGLWSIASFASPYMFYRYENFPTTATNWGLIFPNNPPYKVILNKWDNSQLDMVYGKEWRVPGPQRGNDTDPATPNNETFPFAKVINPNPAHDIWGDGVLGTGDCSSNSAMEWITDKNLIYSFIPTARTFAGTRDIINEICSVKTSQANWSSKLNQNLSRLEATRTAALSLLLNLESKQDVSSKIEIGFIPWSTDPDTNPLHKADLEAAKTIAGGLHFETMRERLLWINRADPNNVNSARPIRLQGATNIYKGLEYARQQLLANNYDRRIIILMTDGEPNPNSGSNSNGGFGAGGLRDYSRNTLGTNAPKSQQVTLFTVGLIAADANLMKDMANSTPDGQAYIANDIASLTPIFESVAYQIQKLALLSTADRYGISL
jgi:Flp pilus assembly pilin Flp